MLFTVTFAILALLALVGAGGLLLYRRILPCLASFFTCAAALAGLYLLLNMQFMALVQLLTGFSLAGAWLTANLSSFPEERHRPALRYLPPAVLLGAAICWSILRGRVGEPIPISSPVWAARGTYLSALGEQLSGPYVTLFVLVGLLLLAAMVSAAYLGAQNGQSEYEES